MSSFEWKDLEYWNTGEWQLIQERLTEMEKDGRFYNPDFKHLFKALELTSFENTKCVIVGQDPYTNPLYATGLAFSIPPNVKTYPPSLVNILKEYSNDLGLPRPPNGDLTPWALRGCLLLNMVPSSPVNGLPLGHYWPEWTILADEILEKLSEKGVVYALLGSHARMYAGDYSERPNCRVIETTHPSPRGNIIKSDYGFIGSRLFSRINACLIEIGLDPVDWRLGDVQSRPEVLPDGHPQGP